MSASKKLRVLIVDDEPHARRTIRLLLGESSSIDSIAEAGSGVSAIEVLEGERFDLLFLDVDLGDLNGFEVLREVDAGRLPVTVFVTAYDEFALEAFEVEAVDYLLKPFSDERFRTAFDRAERQIEADDLQALRRSIEHLLDRSAERQGRPRRIFVRKSGKVLVLPMEEIDWFEAEDYYCRVHSKGRSHLIRRSLSSLEAELDPAEFCRTHRSAIVSLARVRQLADLGRGDALIRLADGSEVRLSRSRRRTFERALSNAR